MHFQPFNPCKDRIHQEPPFRGVGFFLTRVQFSHWDLDGRIVNADQPQPLKDFLGRPELVLVGLKGIVGDVKWAPRHVWAADGTNGGLDIQERTTLALPEFATPPFLAAAFAVIRLLMDCCTVLITRGEFPEVAFRTRGRRQRYCSWLKADKGKVFQTDILPDRHLPFATSRRVHAVEKDPEFLRNARPNIRLFGVKRFEILAKVIFYGFRGGICRPDERIQIVRKTSPALVFGATDIVPPLLPGGTGSEMWKIVEELLSRRRTAPEEPRVELSRGDGLSVGSVVFQPLVNIFGSEIL
jgi:hypothetical protein